MSKTLRPTKSQTTTPRRAEPKPTAQPQVGMPEGNAHAQMLLDLANRGQEQGPGLNPKDPLNLGVLPIFGDRPTAIVDDVASIFDENTTPVDKLLKAGSTGLDLATNPKDLLKAVQSGKVDGPGGLDKLGVAGAALAAANHDATTDDTAGALVEKGSVGLANAGATALMGPWGAVDWATGGNVSGLFEGAASGINSAFDKKRSAKFADNVRSGKHGRVAQVAGHLGYGLGEGLANLVSGGDSRRDFAMTQTPWAEAEHKKEIERLAAKRARMSEEMAHRRQAKAEAAAQAKAEAEAEAEAREQAEREEAAEAEARQEAEERERALAAEEEYRRASEAGAWRR